MLTILQSTRVKAVIFAVVLAIFQKQFPTLTPSPEVLNWIYGLIIAFVAGDTVRPVDPTKKGLFDTLAEAINQAAIAWVKHKDLMK